MSKEDEAVALAMTARDVSAAIARVLPPGHGVLFVVVPRAGVAESFVASSIPPLDHESTGTALAQIAIAILGNEGVTFSQLLEVPPPDEDRRH